MYQTGLQILKCAEDAEDLVQDVFAEVYPHLLDRYENLSMEDWGRLLRRCAKNLAIDRYRQQKRRAELHETMDWQRESNQKELEMKLELEALMADLLETEKEVLTLRHYMGWAWTEVAQKLGMSEIGARKKARRAIEKIQQGGNFEK